MGTVDAILLKLDKEGAIEENMLYLDRAEALAIDNMLGTVGNGHAAGVSFGLFDNSSDMALNLGFTGFRRGSYDFYKTDWKYLNDKQAYGAMIPSQLEVHIRSLVYFAQQVLHLFMMKTWVKT